MSRKMSKKSREYWNEYNKKWRLENLERFKEIQKKYRENNAEKIREMNRKYRLNNKDKISQYPSRTDKRRQEASRQYYLNNIEKSRETMLKRNFGIDLRTYSKMLQKQNGLCAICLMPEIDRTSNGNIKNLSVDHDHKTGKVRGLLCQRCNKGVSFFQDNTNILKSAINYLKPYVDKNK